LLIHKYARGNDLAELGDARWDGSFD